jgi:predicted dehydrogenase
MDVGCYCVNGSRVLAGEPKRVVAEQVVASSGVDASLAGVMRFADDVLGLFECSFELPRRQRLEAEGDEGTLILEAPWRADWGGDILLRRGHDVERVAVPTADSYRLELENLADAAEGKAAPLLGVEDTLGQARAISALYRAADEGRAVTP